MKNLKKTTAGLMTAALLASLLVGCASQVESDLNVSDMTKDTATEVNLSLAAIPLAAYQAENGGFDGFNAAAAEALEPSLNWADEGPAASGVVSIRGAGSDSVVLVTLSGTGTPMCIGISSGGARVQGTTDAQTAADCR